MTMHEQSDFERGICKMLQTVAKAEVKRRGGCTEETAELFGVAPEGLETLLRRRADLQTAFRLCECLGLSVKVSCLAEDE